MGPFPEEGSAAHAQYFTKGVKANSCDLVTFPTAYSLYNRSDYKRCVCDSWFMDENDCIMGQPGDKDKLPQTKDGKTDDQRKAQTQADLDEKRGTPHPSKAEDKDSQKEPTTTTSKSVPTQQPHMQKGGDSEKVEEKEVTGEDAHKSPKEPQKLKREVEGS